MKKVIDKINPEEVIQKIHETFAEVKAGLDSGDFSKEEISNLKNEFADLKLQALKTKISFELHVLSKKAPALSTKEVLIKMLQLLPEDLDEKSLPILTDYVFQNWKPTANKLAA